MGRRRRWKDTYRGRSPHQGTISTVRTPPTRDTRGDYRFYGKPLSLAADEQAESGDVGHGPLEDVARDLRARRLVAAGNLANAIEDAELGVVDLAGEIPVDVAEVLVGQRRHADAFIFAGSNTSRG